MKSIILLFFSFLLFTCSMIAQESTDTSKNAFTEQYYLKTSKGQKKWAEAFAISGGALAAVGGYLWFMAPIAGLSGSGNVEGAQRTGKILTIVGAGLAVISIQLFNASSMNKKRAVLYTGFNRLKYPVNGAKDMLCVGVSITLH